MARLEVKVVPKSSRNRVAGWMGVALKVCVTAPPERGKANAAVIELLAATLRLSRDRVRIIGGAASTRKVFEVDGLDAEEIRRRISEVSQRRSVERS